MSLLDRDEVQLHQQHVQTAGELVNVVYTNWDRASLSTCSPTATAIQYS